MHQIDSVAKILRNWVESPRSKSPIKMHYGICANGLLCNIGLTWQGPSFCMCMTFMSNILSIFITSHYHLPIAVCVFLNKWHNCSDYLSYVIVRVLIEFDWNELRESNLHIFAGLWLCLVAFIDHWLNKCRICIFFDYIFSFIIHKISAINEIFVTSRI